MTYMLLIILGAFAMLTGCISGDFGKREYDYFQRENALQVIWCGAVFVLMGVGFWLCS